MSTTIARAASARPGASSRTRRTTPATKRRRIEPRAIPIEGDAFYTAEQLASRWGVHLMTIWAWSREGTIPAPIKIGPNISRWRGADILAHENRGGPR